MADVGVRSSLIEAHQIYDETSDLFQAKLSLPPLPPQTKTTDRPDLFRPSGFGPKGPKGPIQT